MSICYSEHIQCRFHSNDVACQHSVESICISHLSCLIDTEKQPILCLRCDIYDFPIGIFGLIDSNHAALICVCIVLSFAEMGLEMDRPRCRILVCLSGLV